MVFVPSSKSKRDEMRGRDPYRPRKKAPKGFLFVLGRIVGIEPTHGRFTAGCVKPLHHIRQRVIVYSTPHQDASYFRAR